MQNKKPLASGKANGGANGTHGKQTPSMYHNAAPAVNPYFTNPKLQFGKYKGRAIKTVPADYLKWLTTCDIDEALRAAVETLLDAYASMRKGGQK